MLSRYGIGQARASSSSSAAFSRWSTRSNLSTFSSLQQRQSTAITRTGTAFTEYQQNSFDEDDDDEVVSVCSGTSESSDHDITLPTHFLGTRVHRPAVAEMQRASEATNPTRQNQLVVDPTTRTPLDDDRPPSPWKNSSTKQKIIKELKDATSDIHLQIGRYTTEDFSDVNFKHIRSTYAPRYKHNLFRENLKRILRHLLNSTGPFKADEDEGIDPWTSKKKRSKAWHLLYELRMNKETNNDLNNMTVEQIWESNSLFKQYPLQDFKKYSKDMEKSTAKQRAAIEQEEKDFEKQCNDIPHNEVTDRGEPFWYIHPAKSLLMEDVESGLAYEIKPVALRDTKEEYQQFKLKTFRKHVDQEKERQRAAPYWRHKRNIAARQKIEEERSEMRRQWTVDQMGEIFGSIKVN